MPYTTMNWVNGSTPANATNLNHLETQYTEATSSFNQDEYTPFILSGLIASKDATTASKLDITSGVAYLLQSDNTTRRRAVSSVSQITSAISSTYYLYVQPDGSLYWATTNTPASNSLFLAQVTTDSSGNIATITDKRTLGVGVLTTKDVNVGAYSVPSPLAVRLTQNPTLAATVSGGVTFAQAGAIQSDYDTAASFNGTTGMLSVPTSGLPTGTAAISIECWVKLSANPASTAVPMGQGTWFTGNQLFYLSISTAGVAQLNNATVVVNASGSLALNVWHHLVGTWDGSQLHLYVDGVQQGTGTAATMALTAAAATIGSAPNASAFYGGGMDEVAWYASTLSAARVTAHYNAGISTTSNGYAATVLADAPIRYYRFGDASGATSAANTIAPTATTLVDAGGNLSPQGRLTTLGGQATAGSFGVPVIVAQAINVAYTGTALNNILSYTPSVAGLYRVSLTIYLGGASGATITSDVLYTDGGGHNGSSIFSAWQLGTTVIGLAGATGYTPIRDVVPFPQTIYATPSAAIIVRYQNTTGTANDTLSAIIERLS